MMAEAIGELLSNAAARFGDKPALIVGERTWTFRELDVASERVARNLLARGFGPGDTFSLYSPNCEQWLIGYYAVLKLGGIVNPLNLMLTPGEAVYAMRDCSAVAVLGSADRIAALLPLLAETNVRLAVAYGGEVREATAGNCVHFDVLLEPPEGIAATALLAGGALDQPSTVGYTSGTTGHPKGAVLSHRSILMNTAMTATFHMRTSADTVVSALPCSHVYGNVVMNAAIAYGMTLVLHASFDAVRILSSIEKHRATLFEGVPTMYMYLLAEPRLKEFDLSSVTRCTVGGQTMPVGKMREVEAAFACPLLELWGMTELGGLGTTHPLYGPSRLGSIGQPLPHLQVRIADLELPGAVVPIGQVGELQIRGPMVMQGYLGREDATAEAIDEHGWLRTGDLARVDEDGFIFVVDRLKDMIITAGFNIYPAELERVISEHPAVAMVAVGAVPDASKGELAAAFMVLRVGASTDAAEIERHCRERLAAYKVPRAFHFVDELPKTSSGKILRRKLRELL